MKKHLYSLLGWLIIVIAAVAFGACEGQKNSGGGSSSTSSIVGTWKKSVTNSSGTSTITIQMKADNTGSVSYTGGGESFSYAFAYTFDAASNTGKAILKDPTYGETATYAFRIEWFGADNININIRDEGYSYSDWEDLGLFTREGGSGGGGQETSSIVGTWIQRITDSYYGTITYTIKLNANNTGSVSYSAGNEGFGYNMVYSFDAASNTGTAMLTEPTYGGTMQCNFRVEWLDANRITLYIHYANDSGTEWDNVGVFTRQ